jgi:hypothetical protein
MAGERPNDDQGQRRNRGAANELEDSVPTPHRLKESRRNPERK